MAILTPHPKTNMYRAGKMAANGIAGEGSLETQVQSLDPDQG